MDELNNHSLIEKVEEVHKDVSTEAKLINIENESKTDLLIFMKSKLTQSLAHNELKNAVMAKLHERASVPEPENEDDPKPMGTRDLISTLEVLNKSENDLAGNLLGILKQQVTVINNNNEIPNSISLPNAEKEISTKELHIAKKVMSFIEGISKTEFSELADVKDLLKKDDLLED